MTGTRPYLNLSSQDLEGFAQSASENETALRLIKEEVDFRIGKATARRRKVRPTLSRLAIYVEGALKAIHRYQGLVGETDRDLVTRWTNAIREIANPESHRRAEAQKLLALISAEWDRRLSLAKSSASFKWPTTDAPGGKGGIDLNSPAEGMLRYLGYKVGQGGERSDAYRAALLDEIYLSKLPPLESVDYMKGWDAPKSGHRLRKLANAIASFARNSKRNDPLKYRTAIRHWETDLNHLKKRWYDGRYDWPTTSI